MLDVQLDALGFKCLKCLKCAKVTKVDVSLRSFGLKNRNEVINFSHFRLSKQVND